MKKIRIGVLGPADIAKRKTIPALFQNNDFEYVGVAVATKKERTILQQANKKELENAYNNSLEKANEITTKYGGQTFVGYETLLNSKEIDAVYIALPPALHYIWGEKVLKNGLHVFMEKPFTTNFADTKKLIKIAKEKNLAVAENFAFVYHPQIQKIKELIESNRIGNVQLIRSNFGFPFRSKNDFRYNKNLGGGALLDCGCYTLKAIQLLLDNIEIKDSTLFTQQDFEVDIYGTITATNKKDTVAQLSFSMNQQYKCELEIIGSNGYIKSDRIYTAPEDYTVELIVNSGNTSETIKIEQNNQFLTSLSNFAQMIRNDKNKTFSYNDILLQSKLVEQCLVGETK